MTDTELAHYGVKGMKWGVRREDGSSRSERRAAKKQARIDKFNAQQDANQARTKAKVEASGGSRPKAATAEVGRGVARSVLGAIGTVGLSSIGEAVGGSAGVAISLGAQYAGAAFQGYNAATTLVEVINTSTYNPDND